MKHKSSDTLNVESRQRSRLRRLLGRGLTKKDLELAQRPSPPPPPVLEPTVVYQEPPAIVQQYTEAKEKQLEAERKVAKRYAGFTPGDTTPTPRFDLSGTVSGFPERAPLPDLPELTDQEIEDRKFEEERRQERRNLEHEALIKYQQRQEEAGVIPSGSTAEREHLERIDELRTEEVEGMMPAHPDLPGLGPFYRRGASHSELARRRRASQRHWRRYAGKV
jgi:hypothetical protein